MGFLTASLEKIFKFLITILLGSYRTLGSGWLGGSCRFHPSCSEYAVDAFKEHSVIIALKLVFLRIMKCRPGGSFGYDPVPRKESINE